MSYTERNFKTKKALKDAIANGDAIYAYNPGLGGDLSQFTGTVYLEGPHYPEPHRWYAAAEMVNGLVVKIKA